MSEPWSSEDEPTAAVESLGFASVDALKERTPEPSPGARLGRYLVIEELGRGGMGVVLRAYDPKLQREVALKRVRTRSLDASAQARLVREARAMARLNHPNVVAVYDVEIDEHDCSVTVVMEYVPGTTLRRWLSEQRRTWQEVVEAFVAAGQGLAAAHAEGLLHRDFKLDNVLMSLGGGVRVTDFGLARGTGPRASHDGIDPAFAHEVTSGDDGVTAELTEAGQVMGTPPYMAPEQHEQHDMDERADQYAFCVALWRALTERWPFEGAGRELVRAKRAGPPAWPSHASVPRHVADAIRRGIMPDPADRWPSLPALLAELGRDPRGRRRWLSAVAAIAIIGGGSWATHLVQRARTAAACETEGQRIRDTWNDARAEAITTAFEATGLVYATETWQRSRERIEAYANDWSELRLRVCERVELERAMSPELAEASRQCLDEHRDQLNALLDQFHSADATVVRKAVTASASLPLLVTCADEARLRLRAEQPSSPELRERIAALHSRLFEASAARAADRDDDALELAQAVLDEATELGWVPLVLEARLELADAHRKLGRYEEARGMVEQVYFAAGAAGLDELAFRASSDLTTIVGYRLARTDEGLHWGQVAQMLAQRLGLEEDLAVAWVHTGLGVVHYIRQEHTDAIEHHRRALAIREALLGPNHLLVAGSLNNIGGMYQTLTEYDEALPFLQRSLAIKEATLGREHPDVAISLNNLAAVYGAREEHAEAAALFERSLAIKEAAYGREHPEVASTINNLAATRAELGERDQALALYERALTVWEQALGPEHPRVATALSNMGLDLAAHGEPNEALELHRRALAILENAHGPEHPDVAASLLRIGNVLHARGDHQQAAEHYERALTIRERSEAPPPQLASARFALARALWENGERPRALEQAKSARDGYRSMGAEAADALAEVDAWLATHPD